MSNKNYEYLFKEHNLNFSNYPEDTPFTETAHGIKMKVLNLDIEFISNEPELSGVENKIKCLSKFEDYLTNG